jgi:hypothetical protein
MVIPFVAEVKPSHLEWVGLIHAPDEPAALDEETTAMVIASQQLTSATSPMWVHYDPTLLKVCTKPGHMPVIAMSHERSAQLTSCKVDVTYRGFVAGVGLEARLRGVLPLLLGLIAWRQQYQVGVIPNSLDGVVRILRTHTPTPGC